MKKYSHGQKVYMILKSTGDPFSYVRINRVKMKFKKIVYNGVKYNAAVGYYNYMRENYTHVISYVYPISGGDFYLEGDFITEEDLKMYKIVIPDEMFIL